MTTIELTKSGIAMKKLRGDPEKYLNERRRDVLRYVEMKGSWPISQNWRKYGFTVAEIVGRIRKGGNEPNWEKLPIEFRVDENGIPLPDQFCVETQTSSGASEDTRVTMNIASSGRAVADMVRHNEQVVVEMEDFVRDLPPEETLLSSDADNYRKFQGVMEENRGRQVNVDPGEIWTVVTINSYLHEKDDRGRLRVKTGDAKNDKFEESTVNIYVGKIGKPFSGHINTIITRYSRFDCRTDVRECYKDMKNLLENIRKDVDGKTGKKLTVVSAATKLNYCFALYFVAHHFKKDRENEGALEKLYPEQMDILEEERQKYVKLRDAGSAARKNIAIEAWANIKQKWLSDGGRLDIENVFFQLYEESVGRDDFGRVFVNPKVNIDSDQWGLGKNNFMTKDATTGDWTFHLNKYKTYKKYKSVKILWRGEKAKHDLLKGCVKYFVSTQRYIDVDLLQTNDTASTLHLVSQCLCDNCFDCFCYIRTLNEGLDEDENVGYVLVFLRDTVGLKFDTSLITYLLKYGNWETTLELSILTVPRTMSKIYCMNAMMMIRLTLLRNGWKKIMKKNT